MTERMKMLEDVMDAVAPVLGLQIEDSWRPQVISFLALAAQSADLFMDLPLDDRADEAASIFRPGLTLASSAP